RRHTRFSRDWSSDVCSSDLVLDEAGKVQDTLVNFRKPVAIIPSLAIHLDREANSNRTVNAQTDLPPVVMQAPETDTTAFTDLLREQIASESGLKIRKVLGYELSFYDAQGASFVGLREDFLASARLDNLLSCFIGLQSLLNTSGDEAALLVCNGHKEVCSMSGERAQGPFLGTVLERWRGACKGRAIAHAMMISAHSGHGVHPNFMDRHDENHGPVLNQGPVIKVKHNQRYA